MVSNHLKKIIARIDEAKKLIDKHRPLSKGILEKLREQITLEWTYNSNAIEGNTLTLKETKLVLEDGLTIGGKSLKEHLEVTGHAEAINFVEELAQWKKQINENDVLKMHEIILKNILSNEAGKYRNVRVRITGSFHVTPNPLRVPELMKEFSKKYLNMKDHPIINAALAHFHLVSIHPFIDGNGRVARLLMNLILIKNGYPPAIILKIDRKKYYDSLEKGHSGNIDPFIEMISRTLERSIHLYLDIIPYRKDEYLTLAEASKTCSYDKNYLGVLARRGSIPAIKIKRNWLISKEALTKYVKEHK